jgi:hypothetical protein
MSDLEKEIINELGTRMQSQIDREILWGMLKDIGWTRVTLSRFVDNNHAVDITHWLEKNVKYPFERNGADFIFENPGDAVNFTLKYAG